MQGQTTTFFRPVFAAVAACSLAALLAAPAGSFAALATPIWQAAQAHKDTSSQAEQWSDKADNR